MQIDKAKDQNIELKSEFVNLKENDKILKKGEYSMMIKTDMTRVM